MDLLEAAQQSRPLLATLAGVAGLLFLIIHRRVNAFAALVGAALATGLAAGLAPEAVIKSISDGFGGPAPLSAAKTAPLHLGQWGLSGWSSRSRSSSMSVLSYSSH